MTLLDAAMVRPRAISRRKRGGSNVEKTANQMRVTTVWRLELCDPMRPSQSWIILMECTTVAKSTDRVVSVCILLDL